MRNLIAAASVALLLSACAIFPSYFDYNEQARLVDIIELTKTDSVCSTDEIKTVSRDIRRNVDWLVTYSSSLPNNSKIQDMNRSLSEIVGDFDRRYLSDKPPSRFFCSAKIKNINEAARKMLSVSGRRPRA
jgi:hypothetical protein